MKKILYIGLGEIYSVSPNGVAKKILAQCKEMERRNLDVDLICKQSGAVGFVDNILTGEIKTFFNWDLNKSSNYFKSVYYEYISIKSIIDYFNNHKHYDYVYIRYLGFSRQIIKLLKIIKQSGAKIILEIPTYPYDKELMYPYHLRLLLLRDRHYRKYVKKYVDRIVTYSDDSYIFGVQTIKTYNGIYVDKAPKIEASDTNKFIIAAVAQFSNTHAYDRLLTSFGNYAMDHDVSNMYIYFAGSFKKGVKEQYDRIVSKFNISTNIKYLGFLNKEELEKLYSNTSVAVDVLGPYKVGVQQSNTLKKSEYLSYGLPIITTSSYMHDKIPEYTILVPNDSSIFDFSLITDKVKNIYNDENHLLVKERIQRIGMNTYSCKECMEGIIKYIV